ncbi:MAG: hypothetical protein U0X93_11145 [Anaerolineales bacterium]
MGAGDAGALVVRELQKSSQLNLIPVGFLDDDPAKQKHSIHGVTVIGTVNDLSSAIDLHHVDEVIIAIPPRLVDLVRAINDVCRVKGILAHDAWHLRTHWRQSQRQPPARSGHHRPPSPRACCASTMKRSARRSGQTSPRHWRGRFHRARTLPTNCAAGSIRTRVAWSRREQHL